MVDYYGGFDAGWGVVKMMMKCKTGGGDDKKYRQKVVKGLDWMITGGIKLDR